MDNFGMWPDVQRCWADDIVHITKTCTCRWIVIHGSKSEFRALV